MIEQILIISLFCCSVYVSGEEGMIFYSLKERIRRWATYKDFETRVGEGTGGTNIYVNHPIGLERWWFKPVWGCVLCMASLWGTIGFVLLNYPFNSAWDIVLLKWIATVVCCIIGNGIIWNIYGLLGNLFQYWEDRTK